MEKQLYKLALEIDYGKIFIARVKRSEWDSGDQSMHEDSINTYNLFIKPFTLFLSQCWYLSDSYANLIRLVIEIDG